MRSTRAFESDQEGHSSFRCVSWLSLKRKNGSYVRALNRELMRNTYEWGVAVAMMCANLRRPHHSIHITCLVNEHDGLDDFTKFWRQRMDGGWPRCIRSRCTGRPRITHFFLAVFWFHTTCIVQKATMGALCIDTELLGDPWTQESTGYAGRSHIPERLQCQQSLLRGWCRPKHWTLGRLARSQSSQPLLIVAGQGSLQQPSVVWEVKATWFHVGS
jgi:hypothetical protein